MQKHDIDIRKRVQLAAAISPHGHQRDMFQHAVAAADVVDDGEEQLVVQLIHHVAQQVGHLGTAGALTVQLFYFFTILSQKVLTAGQVQRALLVKTGHAGIADGINGIGKIGIDKKLHADSLWREMVGRLR